MAIITLNIIVYGQRLCKADLAEIKTETENNDLNSWVHKN